MPFPSSRSGVAPPTMIHPEDSMTDIEPTTERPRRKRVLIASVIAGALLVAGGITTAVTLSGTAESVTPTPSGSSPMTPSATPSPTVSSTPKPTSTATPSPAPSASEPVAPSEPTTPEGQDSAPSQPVPAQPAPAPAPAPVQPAPPAPAPPAPAPPAPAPAPPKPPAVVPASMVTNGAYVPWDSCDRAGVVASRDVGSGGTWAPSETKPWTYSTDSATAFTIYRCVSDW